jgi:AmmeMemoRadiSam system protein B/AmmeMemoRadiSam system protein A
MSTIWRSPLEGSWYSEDAEALREMMERCERSSARRVGEEALRTGALGVMAPHAAPEYSGTVAMAAYRTLREQGTRRVVLLAFSHWQSHGGLRVPMIDAYATALGTTPVDRAAVAELAKRLDCVHVVAPETTSDHSAEVQLPLLQTMLPEASIVPLYVGALSPEQREAVARALAALLEEDGDTVLLASSDLTHYGRDFRYVPFPVDADTPENLRRLDAELLECAGSMDAESFATVLAETQATVCGHAPIRLLQRALEFRNGREEAFPETLDYQTSGEITGDWKHSVSYGALAFYPARAWELGVEDQKLLLDSARRTLAHYQDTGAQAPLEAPAGTGSRALNLPAACFVSLHRDGQLRGCIGTKSAQEPLRRAVPGMTLAAATGDPRMSPVAAWERDIEIEISVLTPLKRIASPARFLAGEHGACLEAGERGSILLPQVAAQHGLDAEQFLTALARKAGLGPQAWRDAETRLSVFRAQVFSGGAASAGAAPAGPDLLAR